MAADCTTTFQKIHLTSWSVKGKIPSPNCFIFPAKIANFGLNCCILSLRAENNITRKEDCMSTTQNLPKGEVLGSKFP